MNEEKVKCWSCLQYNAFYIKGNCYFKKKDFGYCQCHKKNVDEQDCCEQWRNGLLSKKFRTRTVSEQLKQIIHKLYVIEQVMNGDINVNEL